METTDPAPGCRDQAITLLGVVVLMVIVAVLFVSAVQAVGR